MRLYRRSFKARVVFGLVYLPTAVIVGLMGALIALIPVLRDVLDVAGTQSGTGVVFALIVGGLANLAAYVVVNALVSAHMDERTAKRSPVESARFVWAKRNDLVRGFVRATLIVGGLMISIVGIPWGIRQLVRYQFLPQAVILEGDDAKRSLARSSDLVTGRWLHTAVMIAVFNGLLIVSSMTVGLLVLVLFASIPLWLFTAIMPLVHGLIVPLTASAQTMLYGDAVAESRGLQADPEPEPQMA